MDIKNLSLTTLEEFIKKTIDDKVALINGNNNPNINPLWFQTKDADALRLNIKSMGYQLARQLTAELPVREGLQPNQVGLTCKPSTQADMESDWAAYWLSELQIPVTYHRKYWEFAYALQALYERGKLEPGAKGLGFGCGMEPLPSYFASKGVDVVVTDLPPEDEAAKAWQSSGEHAVASTASFFENIVERDAFDRHISLRYLDMNAIPSDLGGFDFCWSICALEHLGSLQKGLDFIENSLATLKSGGIAVHTTEFNFANDDETIDDWVTVLYQRKHFEQLAADLTAKGQQVAPLDFNVGGKPMDCFIDIPPYLHDWPDLLKASWEGNPPHLKLSIDGFASTCFGLIIQKG